MNIFGFWILLIIGAIIFTGCEIKSNNSITNNTTDTTPVLSSSSIFNVDENITTEVIIGKLTILTSGDSDITSMELNGTGFNNFLVSTSGEITLASGIALDYENIPLYILSARAENSAGWSEYINIEITVNDITDIVPVLSDVSFTIDENSTEKTVVGQIPIIATGDSSITNIELSGTDFDDFLVSTTGEITVSAEATLDYETKNIYNLRARAENSAGFSEYVDVEISVNDIVEPEQIVPMVVITISFNDFTIDDNDSNWHDKIFGTSDTQLNHYYKEVSYGKFALTEANETYGAPNDGIIRVTLPINHPGDSGMNQNEIKNAINLADGYINFSAYDKDNNGSISRDELQILFIAAGGEASYGDLAASSVWAKTKQLTTSPSAPILDGVTVMDSNTNGAYTLIGEKQGDHYATIGIIAHELGHGIFDLPDLYDTDGSSAGIGRFGLMGTGMWGFEQDELPGQSPVHPCAWSKIRLGWVTPEIVNATTTEISMYATHLQNFNIVKIPTNNSNEYFLVENRSTYGYDAGLYILDETVFSGGLAIWHIDDSYNSNTNEDHKLVDLEEANNPELDSNNSVDGTLNNLYFIGNATQFNNTSTPSSKKYDGTSTNISVVTGLIIGGDIVTIDISK